MDWHGRTSTCPIDDMKAIHKILQKASSHSARHMSQKFCRDVVYSPYWYTRLMEIPPPALREELSPGDADAGLRGCRRTTADAPPQERTTLVFVEFMATNGGRISAFGIRFHALSIQHHWKASARFRQRSYPKNKAVTEVKLIGGAMWNRLAACPARSCGRHLRARPRISCLIGSEFHK